MTDTLQYVEAWLRLLRRSVPADPIEGAIVAGMIEYLEAPEEPALGLAYSIFVSNEQGSRGWRYERYRRAVDPLLVAAGERLRPGETLMRQAEAIVGELSAICRSDEDGGAWVLDKDVPIKPGSAADFLRQALAVPGGSLPMTPKQIERRLKHPCGAGGHESPGLMSGA